MDRLIVAAFFAGLVAAEVVGLVPPVETTSSAFFKALKYSKPRFLNSLKDRLGQRIGPFFDFG